MYCPETIIFHNRFLLVMRHDKHDYCSRPVPFAQVINPLRYQVTIKPGCKSRLTINKDAWLWLKLQNITWPIRRLFK